MFQSKGFPTGEEPCHDPIKTRVSNSEYIFSITGTGLDFILALRTHTLDLFVYYWNNEDENLNIFLSFKKLPLKTLSFLV